MRFFNFQTIFDVKPFVMTLYFAPYAKSKFNSYWKSWKKSKNLQKSLAVLSQNIIIEKNAIIPTILMPVRDYKVFWYQHICFNSMYLSTKLTLLPIWCIKMEIIISSIVRIIIGTFVLYYLLFSTIKPCICMYNRIILE